MKPLLAASWIASLALAGLAPPAARAADTTYTVFLDGRPLDAKNPSALLHGNRVYINVVRFTKAYNGLLSFGKGDRTVKVTVATRTLQFTVGSLIAEGDGKRVKLPGTPFLLNGDTYVPLAALARLGGSKLSVDAKHRAANLTLPQPPANSPPSPAAS